MQHWLDETACRRRNARMGDPDLTALKKYVPASVYNKAAAALNPKPDPVYSAIFGPAGKVHAALTAAGIKEPAATFGTYQAYHETAAFKDPKFTRYNNASGIMYAGQRNAKKGANGYAYFNTLADWAHAMAHEMTKKSNPAGAKTIEDYVARLKKNGYFTDTTDNYLHGLTRARLVLAAIPAADAADNTTNYNPNTGISTPKMDSTWFKAHPLATGVILTVGGIVVIKFFNNLVQ
jgi:hypothetical protein